jgi:hypothetical protein
MHCFASALQIKTLLSQMEVVSAKGAASAREHAEKSRALAQRGVKLVCVIVLGAGAVK